MSQSLFYDAISSTYEDGVDDLSCFTPDNIQSLTPDFATSSQQTVDSIDSEFLRPAPRPTVPSPFHALALAARKPMSSTILWFILNG
jgi:hypothetical protein